MQENARHWAHPGLVRLARWLEPHLQGVAGEVTRGSSGSKRSSNGLERGEIRDVVATGLFQGKGRCALGSRHGSPHPRRASGNAHAHGRRPSRPSEHLNVVVVTWQQPRTRSCNKCKPDSLLEFSQELLLPGAFHRGWEAHGVHLDRIGIDPGRPGRQTRRGRRCRCGKSTVTPCNHQQALKRSDNDLSN